MTPDDLYQAQQAAIRDGAFDPTPADVLDGAEQLALPPGCQCSYALSHSDGRWHVVTREHCRMHGQAFAAGERARWIAPDRIVVIDRAHFEHFVTLNLPDRWLFDIADAGTGKILLYGAHASELARLP